MASNTKTKGNSPVGTGRPGPGRPPGTPNKTTAVLKDAILLAAEQTGLDGKGKEGLTGYLKRVAAEDVKAFSALLGRVLPMQVTGADGAPIVASVTLVPMKRGEE